MIWNRLVRFLDSVSRILSSVSGTSGIIFIFAMTVLITVDVLGRYFLDMPTYIATEFSGYMLVGIAFLGLAYTQRKGRHIQITIITSRLSQRLQEPLKIAVLVVGLIFVGWLTWTTWDPVVVMFEQHRTSLTTVATPLWIPVLLVPVGLGMFTIELLVELRRAIVELIKARDSG